MSEDENTYREAWERAVRTAKAVQANRLSEEQLDELCETLVHATAAHQVLLVRNSARFSRIEVCRALAAWSHDLRHEDPKLMLEIAELAQRVAEWLRPEEPRDESVVADTRVLAWLHLGNALRVSSYRHRAELALRKALTELPKGSGDPLLAAQHDSYLGALRVDQGRNREALELFRCAERVYCSLQDWHAAGEVLVAIGRLHRRTGNIEQATRCLYTSLGWLRGSNDRHTKFAALQLLAFTLNDAGLVREGVLLLREVTCLLDLDPGDALLLRVQWLEGRMTANLGCLDKAIELVDGVRRAFIDLDLPYDAALAALELAGFYLQQGRLDEVQALALDMVPIFVSEEIHREARIALLLFAKAAEAKRATLAQIEVVVRRVEQARRKKV